MHKIGNSGLNLQSQYSRCTGTKHSRSSSLPYWVQCLIMIGISTCLLLICEYSLLTVSPWKTWSTVSSSFYIWYYQVQSHFAKNRIHTYFVFQVLAQSICMNCNIYIKCERSAPSSKSKNFLPVQTVYMGHYFILRYRRCVWAWQFLLFAAWLNGGTNYAIATEYRLREWWGHHSLSLWMWMLSDPSTFPSQWPCQSPHYSVQQRSEAWTVHGLLMMLSIT